MTQSQTTAPSLLGLEEDGRDLFGLAAHKLNTPLACIRGFVSTLLQRGEQLDTETVQQFLSLVLTQTDRLQGLVRDFLLLARVNGGIEALARPFRPRDVLLNLVDDLGTEGVRVRFAGDVDAEVVGDAELVKLALRPLDPPQFAEMGVAAPQLEEVSPAARKLLRCIRRALTAPRGGRG